MVFYIAIIIYNSVIISLTYCFLNISPPCSILFLLFYYYFFIFGFENLSKHGSKIG